MARLERSIRNLDVINFGYQGSGQADQLKFYNRVSSLVPHDMVIVNLYAYGDLTDNIYLRNPAINFSGNIERLVSDGDRTSPDRIVKKAMKAAAYNAGCEAILARSINLHSHLVVSEAMYFLTRNRIYRRLSDALPQELVASTGRALNYFLPYCNSGADLGSGTATKEMAESLEAYSSIFQDFIDA